MLNNEQSIFIFLLFLYMLVVLVLVLVVSKLLIIIIFRKKNIYICRTTMKIIERIRKKSINQREENFLANFSFSLFFLFKVSTALHQNIYVYIDDF